MEITFLDLLHFERKDATVTHRQSQLSRQLLSLYRFKDGAHVGIYFLDAGERVRYKVVEQNGSV